MERREFASESIQNFPSSVYHKKATFFEKPASCSLVIMLVQCASLELNGIIVNSGSSLALGIMNIGP